MRFRNVFSLFALFAVSGVVILAEPADRAVSAVSRTVLLDTAIHHDGAVGHVTMQRIRMAPGVKAPPHSHPCPTFGLVLEGEITYQLDGAEPQVLRPGDAFNEPAGTRVIRFDNTGDGPAVFVVNYLLGSPDDATITFED